MSTLRLSLSVLLLLCTLSAQTRRPLAGVVTGPDGKGLGGATITLCWAPNGEDDPTRLDVVAVTADGSGRFKANLLPCAVYSAWAAGPIGADGKQHTSSVVATAVGRVLELAATHPHQPRKVAITGLGAWPDLAPFRLACCTAGAHTARIVVDVGAEDRELVLPLLPWGPTYLDLLTNDGHTLATSHLFATPTGELASFGILPPQTVAMRVVDDKDQPIADAEIRHRSVRRHFNGEPGSLPPPGIQRWRPVGRTDQDGRMLARIPEAKDPFQLNGWQDLAFVATKPGYALSHSGFGQQPYFDGKKVPREGANELRFVLRQEQPLRGRLLLGPERPVAGIAVQVVGDMRIDEQDGGGWSSEAWSWTTITDAAGRFALADLPTTANNLRLFVGAGVPPLAAEERPKPTPPQPFALAPLATRPIEEVVLDLSALKMVDVQLNGIDGSPAVMASLTLLSKESGWDTKWSLSCVPDPMGRASLRVQPGDWLLFACDGRGHVARELKASADERLQLRLEPMPVMRGTVRDEEGKPVAGAQLHCQGSSWMHVGEGTEAALSQIAQTLNWSFFQRVHTADDGSYEAPFLARKNMSYHGFFRIAARQSERFEFRTDDGPIDVVIR